LIKGLGIGGAERLVAESALFWNRVRYNYHVAYVLPWKRDLVPELESLGVAATCIGGHRGLTPASLVRLHRLIKELGADVVHVHSPSVGIGARLITTVPIVYTEHNLAGSYRLPTRVANRLTYTRNHTVTAVSQSVGDSLEGYPGPDPTVIPNGVAIEVEKWRNHSARSMLGIDNDRPLIVHVGNIRPGKGHETLIRAAAILKERCPQCLLVSIGGEKHPGDLRRLQALAVQSGVAESLRFLGRRADALAFIAGADVYVNPSDVEGLPVSILEAMSFGRPIVATAVGGVPSAIRDRETGLLVEPGDAAALAQAVAVLIEDQNLGEKLGSAAESLAAGSYGLQPMVAAFEDIYEEVLNG